MHVVSAQNLHTEEGRAAAVAVADGWSRGRKRRRLRDFTSKAVGEIHCQVQSLLKDERHAEVVTAAVCSAGARAATSGRGYLHFAAGIRGQQIISRR